MSRTVKLGGHVVGADERPFVIAEMSGNHNGSLHRALAIVDAIAESGAQAVKLQTYRPDTITIDADGPAFRISAGHDLWGGERLWNLYERAHTPWEWHEPIFTRAGRGEPVAVHDALLPFTKHGILENAWFDLNYLPVRDDDGRVAGTLCLMVETTADVLSRRRLDILSALSTATSGSATRESAFRQTLSVLAASSQDVPFAVGYHLDGQEGQAHLAGVAGVQPGSPMAPDVIGLTSARSWPLRRVVTRGEPLVIDGPFAETKEQFLGFFVVDCMSLEEAIDAARDLARANPGMGSYEIRPIALYKPSELPT